MAKNLKSFLYPKSIAIIGASQDKKKIGYQILNNIISNGYKGAVYPINLKEKEIEGLKAYASISFVKKKIDLVIVAIPAEYALNELVKCAKAGVKNIIIITAGFSEEGGVGKLRELKLKELAKKYNLNILGPNCFGVVNTNIKLNATFSRSKNKNGYVAFISQSGAICAAVMDWAQHENLGFSKFISIGNKAVLDENDFLEYFIDDYKTDMVVAYLEEIENGEKFMNIVSRISQKKPVAILKAGQSEAGAKAAMSHTGSLAGSNEAVMAGLNRADAIILDNIEEMFDLLLVYHKNKIVKNQDIYIISNAGGPLVTTVDLMGKLGLNLGKYSKEMINKLSSALPPIVDVKNPLDIIGDADALRYKAALEVILKDKNVSNVLILLTPQSATEAPETAKIIADLSRKYKDKLIFTSFIGGESLKEAKEILEKNKIVNFDFPNKAVIILSKIFKFEDRKKRLRTYEFSESGKADLLSGEKKGKTGSQMDYIESINLLKKYKIPTVPTLKIEEKEDLWNIEYPSALKAVGPGLIHKTEKKAIALDLKNKIEAAKAYDEFAALLEEGDNYCVSQPMLKGNIEMIAGFKRDDSFGPIIMVGMGGIYTEVFKDIQTEVGDVDIPRAEQMIKNLKIYPILSGARGKKNLDTKSLAKTIVKLGKLARENKNIQELDINPLFINSDGVMAADVRIII